jgi:hypothetical protein
VYCDSKGSSWVNAEGVSGVDFKPLCLDRMKSLGRLLFFLSVFPAVKGVLSPVGAGWSMVGDISKRLSPPKRFRAAADSRRTWSRLKDRLWRRSDVSHGLGVRAIMNMLLGGRVGLWGGEEVGWEWDAVGCLLHATASRDVERVTGEGGPPATWQ